MKKLAIGIIAASAIMFAVPASAQVHVREGNNGVHVRIGHGHGWHKGWRHRGDYARANCRVEVTRVHRPNGTTITKRERRCH